MKLSLSERLIRFLMKHPHTKYPKGHLCDLARKATGATGETTGRRLRAFRLASGLSLEECEDHDDPEYLMAFKLLDGGKVIRTKIDGHAWYHYEPPATRRKWQVKVIEGRAVGGYVDVPVDSQPAA